MKAIETTYKGYRFRSRTEARWAVFFDNLVGITEWQYEPEGFELDDGRTRYLPDFRVTHSELGDTWFEVKPQLGSVKLITDAEWNKMQRFAWYEKLILLDGPPTLKPYFTVGREDRLNGADFLFNKSLPGFWNSQHMLDLEKAVNASRAYRYDKNAPI